MARIELAGKYAVGEHRFAIVDDADFAWLNSWRWKAKWNGGGNNVYAVRNSIVDGRNLTIRMHRAVLGLDAGARGEVDHINRNSLDNRRENLRVATRTQNIRNSRTRVIVYSCAGCGSNVASTVRQMSRRRKWCCPECRGRSCNRRGQVLLLQCEVCSRGMVGKSKLKRFCSDACRCKAKRGPRRLSVNERLMAALATPGVVRDVAVRSATNESDVRRVLANLRKAGHVRIIGKRTGDKGWSSAIYALA